MSSRCVVVRGKLLGERPWSTGNAEWVTVPIQETLQRVLCRTTNRIFVGVSLCLWPFSHSTIHSVACDNFLRPGLWLSDFEFELRGQCLQNCHGHPLVSEASQAVRSLLYPCSHFKFTEHTLVLFYACYLIFLQRSNNKLNLSDLWSRSDLRRWRSMGRTGMISQFVGPPYLYLSH